MQWLRSHPYAAGLSVAGILVVLGAYIVQRQAAAPTRAATSAWGRSDTMLLNPTSYMPTSYTPPQAQENIMQNVKSGPPYTYSPPATFATPPSTEGEDSFDFDAFVAMLSQNSASAQKTPADTKTTAPTYSFIPNGLMST